MSIVLWLSQQIFMKEKDYDEVQRSDDYYNAKRKSSWLVGEPLTGRVFDAGH